MRRSEPVLSAVAGFRLQSKLAHLAWYILAAELFEFWYGFCRGYSEIRGLRWFIMRQNDVRPNWVVGSTKREQFFVLLLLLFCCAQQLKPRQTSK